MKIEHKFVRICKTFIRSNMWHRILRKMYLDLKDM